MNPPAAGLWLRLVARLASIQLAIAMLALTVMGAVTVVDVFMKYVFARPVTGAYDAVESLLPAVIFNGLPATLLRRQNIVIDLADHIMGEAGTRVLTRMADAVMLVILVTIAWAMVAPALQAFDYGDRKLELGLPVADIWAAALVGMAGSILVAFTLAIRPAPAAAPGLR